MQEISVIFPCYNEAERLPQLFDALEKFSIENTKLYYIFVDDASRDGSAKLVREWIESRGGQVSARLIAKEVNGGKGPAVVSGDAAATTELRCFLDVDLSTPLRFIEEALIRYRERAPELIIASRHVPGAELAEAQGLVRLALGRMFSFFTSIFHQSAFSDTQCGFKVWTTKFSREVVQTIESSRWSFDIAWIMQAESQHFLIEELPVTWINDDRSKVSAVKDGIKMAKDVLRYRVLYGSKVLLVLSLLMFFVGLSMAMRSSNDMEIYLMKAWIPLSRGITDIYEPLRSSQGAYYYSPLFALIGVPFAFLNVTVAKIVYYFLYLALALCGWIFLKRLIRYSGFNFRLHSCIPIIFFVAIMNSHFGQALTGNISAQIAALMIASGYCYFVGMRKTSAALLALAINFKVYPAFLLLFFFLRRDFKFLWSCFVASVVCLVLPAFVVGWEANILMLSDQIASLKAYGPQNDLGRLSYQSLTAMFVRGARATSLDEGMMIRVAQAVGIISVVWFWTKLGTYSGSAKRGVLVWIFSMLVLGLIAPASWVHHFGFVYSPAILFVLGHIYSDNEKRWRSAEARFFMAFVLLYSFTTEGLMGKSWNDTLEAWSVPAIGLLALAVSYVISAQKEIQRAA